MTDADRVLRTFFDENGLLAREAGVYWRSGGTVDV